MARGRRARQVLGLAAVVALSATSTAGWVGFDASDVPADPTATRAPAGCPTLPDHADQDNGRRVRDVIPRDAAATAVDHANRGGVDIPGALQDFRELMSASSVISEIELPSTGLVVEVRSDGQLAIDPTALDELALAPLMLHHRFDDPRLSTLARCYERRIVHERELAGSRLRLFVPADPRTCFRAGRLTAAGDDPAVLRCDASGITFPVLPGSVRVLGVEVARLRSEAMIVVATGADSAETAPSIVALKLAHELVHHYDNAMGLLPWSSPLSHYEQRAYYIESRLRRWYDRPHRSLPLPFRFPDAAGSEP